MLLGLAILVALFHTHTPHADLFRRPGQRFRAET